MAKSHLQLVPPLTENRTVVEARPPRRPPNRELREREHLTDAEVERLIEAAKANRHGVRDALMVLMDYRRPPDALMVLMAYRHGLRAAEVTDLKWEAVDFDRGEMRVNRLKGGLPHRSGAARTSQAQARQSAVDPVRVRVRARGAPIG